MSAMEIFRQLRRLPSGWRLGLLPVCRFHPTRNRKLFGRKTRTASMRQYILFAAAWLCSYPAIAQTQNQASDNKTAANRPPWPLQVEIRVPFEPTAFPSGPHVYLMYELHLTNFMPMPVSLSRIEVLD